MFVGIFNRQDISKELLSVNPFGDVENAGNVKPFAIISVTDTYSSFTALYPLPATCAGVLAVKFDDISIGQDDYHHKAIQEKQADVIASFVKSLESDVKFFSINCDAGISRSAGIAAALCEYFEISSAWIWGNKRYHPNLSVYEAVKKSLKVPSLKDYYTSLKEG